MFVVKRPFRNLGKVLVAGTVITEPATIKRFNGRIAEGKIIEVTEQTYEATAKYFKEKFGVDIPAFHKPTEEAKAEEAKAEEAKAEEAKAEVKTPVVSVTTKI